MWSRRFPWNCQSGTPSCQGPHRWLSSQVAPPASATMVPSTAKPLQVFDFRSDTVTQPFPAMYEAMVQAQVGDDVMGEDASTRELELYMAELTGHEDALFGASGTMTNQLALRCWLRGSLESVLLDARSHIHKYENAGIAYHCQAGVTPIRPRPGTPHLTLDRIEPQIIGQDIHCAQTRVIALENTMNGGIFPLTEIRKIGEFAKSQGLIFHLDGARLWNASAETGIPLKEWCTPFDTVSLCLSKGVGAPVGSVLVGPKHIITLARHYRKLWGGGWRQSGPLAAAAKFAIQHTFANRAADGTCLLQQDHQNTRWLANELLSRIPGIKIANKVETNMLFVDIRDACEGISVDNLVKAVDAMNASKIQKGAETVVKIASSGYAFDSGERDLTLEDHDYVIRFVLHHQITREACKLLVDSIEEAVSMMKR